MKKMSQARLDKMISGGARIKGDAKVSASKKTRDEEPHGEMHRIALSMAQSAIQNTEQSSKIMAELKDAITSVMNTEKRAVPCRLKINRSDDGFIDSIDVLPMQPKRTAH